jgi:membrane fusion protein (multidrug efflux system)
LTNVQTGQPASLTIDTYPGIVWKGVVDSISPASGSSFSLLPAQNTTGNWVKVVQRIPMRVRIEDVDGKPPLRVGMSVTVEVDTGRARGLPNFLAKLFGSEAMAKTEPSRD